MVTHIHIYVCMYVCLYVSYSEKCTCDRKDGKIKRCDVLRGWQLTEQLYPRKIESVH